MCWCGSPRNWQGSHVCVWECAQGCARLHLIVHTHTPVYVCVFYMLYLCVCLSIQECARVSLSMCVIFKCVFGCVSGIWHACEGLSPSKPVVEYVDVRCRVLVSRLVRLLSHCVAAALPGCHLIGRCDFLMHTGA